MPSLDRRRLLQLLAAAGTAVAAGEVAAEPRVPADRDRSVAEISSRRVPGSDIVTGVAVIGINAPLERVKAVVLDFSGYHRILPRLDQSRIVGKKDGYTDLYMRAPVLGGLANISGVARFSPPRPYHVHGVRIDGELVKGNLEAWRGGWRLSPCGPKRTVLKMEMWLEIELPVPVSSINKWLLWACGKSVTAVRDMAECGRSGVRGD